jgi:hypothetical protein
MIEFVNPNTMNNAKGEALVVSRLQQRGFVVNKPSVKNQPVYDLSVHLSNSIERTAYIQVKTRGENNPAGYRIGTKKSVQKLADWLGNLRPQNYFFALVDFYQDGNIHIIPAQIFIEEVMGWADHYLSQPKKDGTARKDTGAWTFEPKHSDKVYKQSKESYDAIISYLEGN